MSIQEIMAKIVDRGQPKRFFLVAELGDRLEDGQYDEETSGKAIRQLIEIGKSESDAWVHNSILDLLAGYYLPGKICSSEIEAFIIAQLPTLSVTSLDYALGIISESELDERVEILTQYAQSDNPGIQEIANFYLELEKTRWAHRDGHPPST